MIKQAPSLGRMVAMVVFTLSCFGILLFLWLSFGGSIQLRPEGYRFQARIPEAATLAVEADVRLAGVNVGKVKTKELDKGGSRTKVEVELQADYAPIPKDSRVILRQKTLLGESYLELAQGRDKAGMLEDGGELAVKQVDETTELDEIFTAFDEETRDAFQEWITELSKAIRNGRGEDVSSALGNLEGFATDGADLLKILDEQEIAVRGFVKNTGEVFGAINEREGALGELITNANNTFEATASRDESLAQTFEIFPTFLDESRATLARLERFSRNARPVVNDLKPAADDLGPTVRRLGKLSPDLQRLFRDLPPLIRASKKGLPDASRVLSGAEPVFEGLHVFLSQLNPILSYANFHQATIAGFLTIGGTNFGCVARIQGGCDQYDPSVNRYQVNFSVIEDRSFARFATRPPWERGNAYMHPNALLRAGATGVIESFDCNPGGTRANALDVQSPALTGPPTQPPCFVAPGSLYDGTKFVKPREGRAPKVAPPVQNQGNPPANDPNPGDPVN